MHFCRESSLIDACGKLKNIRIFGVLFSIWCSVQRVSDCYVVETEIHGYFKQAT